LRINMMLPIYPKLNAAFGDVVGDMIAWNKDLTKEDHVVIVRGLGNNLERGLNYQTENDLNNSTINNRHINVVRFMIFTAMTILIMFFWVQSTCGLVGKASALTMETACFSKTLASTNQSTQWLNPKEHNLDTNVVFIGLMGQCDLPNMNKWVSSVNMRLEHALWTANKSRIWLMDVTILGHIRSH
jgi:hypothetical protein